MKKIFIIQDKRVLMVLAFGLTIGVGCSEAGVLDEPKLPSNAKAKTLAANNQPIGKANSTIAGDQYGDPLPEGAVARLGARRFRHEGGAWALSYSPDGKSLVGYTSSAVILWDAATGKERYRLPRNVYFHKREMAISPDGTLLVIPQNHAPEKESKVSFFDLQTGKSVRTLSLPNEEGKHTRFRHLCFTPDGKNLVCSTEQGTAILFDARTGQVHRRFGIPGWHTSYFAVSPDGRKLAVACQDVASENWTEKQRIRMQLWDIDTEKLIRIIHNFPEAKPGVNIVTAVKFSPNGKLLAFGVSDRVFLYDPESGKNLRKFVAEEMGQPAGLGFTPDSKKLIIARKYVRVWDVAAGKILHTLKTGTAWSVGMALSSSSKFDKLV